MVLHFAVVGERLRNPLGRLPFFFRIGSAGQVDCAIGYAHVDIVIGQGGLILKRVLNLGLQRAGVGAGCACVTLRHSAGGTSMPRALARAAAALARALASAARGSAAALLRSCAR